MAGAAVAADLISAVGLTVVGAVDLPEALRKQRRQGIQLGFNLPEHSPFRRGPDVEAVEEGPDEIVVPSGPLPGEQPREGRHNGGDAVFLPLQLFQSFAGEQVKEDAEGMARQLPGIVPASVGVEDVA